MKYMKYKYFLILPFTFLSHKIITIIDPDIKIYDNNKIKIVHSDCIFGPKNFNIKLIDIFIKNIKNIKN